MSGKDPSAIGVRGATLAVMSMLVRACSTGASVAPTDTPPTAPLSPTPGQTVEANSTRAVSGLCAETIPDGRIAFTVGDGQANGIAVVDADGSGYRLVVEPRVISGQPHGGTEGPSWMGQGSILFDSNRNGGPDDWHLFTVEDAGEEPEQITSGPDGIENYGVLSSDGTFIAFTKYLATGNPGEPWGGGGIFVADPNGGNERQVTVTARTGVDEWPDISPDGAKIAFTRGHVGDDGGLFVVNLDGTGLTRIVPAQMEPLRPRWSADGRQIAFSSNGDRFLTESANVWIVNADGTAARQVTDEAGGGQGGQAYFPNWSPDDSYLAFAHHRPGSGTNDLAAIPSAGGATCTVWAGTAAGGAGESDWLAP